MRKIENKDPKMYRANKVWSETEKSVLFTIKDPQKLANTLRRGSRNAILNARRRLERADPDKAYRLRTETTSQKNRRLNTFLDNEKVSTPLESNLSTKKEPNLFDSETSGKVKLETSGSIKLDDPTFITLKYRGKSYEIPSNVRTIEITSDEIIYSGE
jgi:hypothetical protein